MQRCKQTSITFCSQLLIVFKILDNANIFDTFSKHDLVSKLESYYYYCILQHNILALPYIPHRL